MACIYCNGCNYNGGYPCSTRESCIEFNLSDEAECKNCEDFLKCSFTFNKNLKYHINFEGEKKKNARLNRVHKRTRNAIK
jgi:hypothetical protein